VREVAGVFFAIARNTVYYARIWNNFVTTRWFSGRRFLTESHLRGTGQTRDWNYIYHEEAADVRLSQPELTRTG
jgi:hypothetical protein